MNNEFDWKEQTVSANLHSKQDQIEYSTSLNGYSDEEIKMALKATIEKAVTCLPKNIEDNSRYFLFEWQTESSSLTIVVTDDTKKNDSLYRVTCKMTALNHTLSKRELASSTEDKIEAYSDFVKYFVKDYLTTCSSFMQFSLVAIFHNKHRDQTQLL